MGKAKTPVTEPGPLSLCCWPPAQTSRRGPSKARRPYIGRPRLTGIPLLSPPCWTLARTPNARNLFGSTPLHRAAEFNQNPAVIIALLDAGADPTKARNSANKTPWDNAKDNEALKGSDAYWRLNDARF